MFSLLMDVSKRQQLRKEGGDVDLLERPKLGHGLTGNNIYRSICRSKPDMAATKRRKVTRMARCWGANLAASTGDR
jgi:hypothetical protein